MKSELGKKHMRVINSAPDEMKARLITIAINCLIRANQDEATPEKEALYCYLDIETLDEMQKEY